MNCLDLVASRSKRKHPWTTHGICAVLATLLGMLWIVGSGGHTIAAEPPNVLLILDFSR